MSWAITLAKRGELENVTLVPEKDFTVTSDEISAYPKLSKLACNSRRLRDAPTLDLTVREMVLLRFGVIRVINALAAKCLTLIDSSMAELPWTLAHLVKQFGYLLFNDTKVGCSGCA
jgi:hypothetical protein